MTQIYADAEDRPEKMIRGSTHLARVWRNVSRSSLPV